MTEDQRKVLEAAIMEAFIKTIEELGIEAFKKTSLFGANR